MMVEDPTETGKLIHRKEYKNKTGNHAHQNKSVSLKNSDMFNGSVM